MSETRQTFVGLAHWQIVFWYVLIGVSVAIFLLGVGRLYVKYRRGRAAGLERPGVRLRRAGRIVLSHSWIRRRDPVAGLAHLLVFYGFSLLALGTAILAFQDDLTKPAFGWQFWYGRFYLGYSLTLDVAGVALLLGLAIFATRRGVQRPFRLDYRRPDRAVAGTDRRMYVIGDWTFLSSLFFLAFTGLVLEAFRDAQTNPSFEQWAPVGWAIGRGFRAAGLDGSSASTAHYVLWWVHGVVALTFVSSIPFTKAVHMLTGPSSVAVRDPQAGKVLPPLPSAAKSEQVGYGVITDLSWRHLLDLDACTKCGKCHEACPATRSGYPLSPRDLVLDLREIAEGSIGIRSELGIGPLHEPGELLVGNGGILPETVWSCMNCMACVEICPVGIEHVPIINELRRRLVDRGELDSQLQSTLETIFTSGNSFGEPKRKRGRWARELPFPVKDIRKEPAELLWFLGDYASFDPRAVQITQGLARILRHAGVDFGILYDAERNAGCDVRRVGEEGLYAMLAAENVKSISACDFDRILTWDPHSFHTIRNEYRAFGGDWTVLHHSQLLLELLESGALEPARSLGYTVTYHDPCTLGRYNGVYDAPRRVLERLGVQLLEMPRNRDNSFCCGAGGGRIWMNELRAEGARRPSEQRIDEALALGGLDYFVVACPKDVTMYEDAIKTSGHQGEIELRELSELVLEVLDLPAERAAAASRKE